MPVLVRVHLEGHPLLDGVVARDDALDGGVEVLALGLGEEPDVTEVDPEQRHPGPRDSSAPRRIVPSPPSTHDELAPGAHRVGSVARVDGRGGLHPGDLGQGGADELVGGRARRRRMPEAGGDVGGQLLRLPAGVGHEEDAARRGRHRRPPVVSVVISRTSARTRSWLIVSDGSDRAHNRYSVLPVVPLIGLVRMPCTCRPWVPTASTTASTARCGRGRT